MMSSSTHQRHTISCCCPLVAACRCMRPDVLCDAPDSATLLACCVDEASPAPPPALSLIFMQNVDGYGTSTHIPVVCLQ